MSNIAVTTPKTVNIKLLMLAVLLSLAVHAGLLFGYQPQKTIPTMPQTFSVAVQTNYSHAKTVALPSLSPLAPLVDKTPALSPAKTTLQPDPIVPLAEDGLVPITTTAPAELSPIALEETNDPALNTSVVALGGQVLLPENEASPPLQLENGIAFQALPETLTLEALEVIPEVSDLAPKNLSDQDLLAGIDAKFKSAITATLSQGLNRIKPTIEEQSLEGSLRFQFVINRAGDVVFATITQSSGNPKLDALIRTMIQENAPYARLPAAYQSELLKFSYPISIKLK